MFLYGVGYSIMYVQVKAQLGMVIVLGNGRTKRYDIE